MRAGGLWLRRGFFSPSVVPGVAPRAVLWADFFSPKGGRGDILGHKTMYYGLGYTTLYAPRPQDYAAGACENFGERRKCLYALETRIPHTFHYWKQGELWPIFKNRVFPHFVKKYEKCQVAARASEEPPPPPPRNHIHLPALALKGACARADKWFRGGGGGGTFWATKLCITV